MFGLTNLLLAENDLLKEKLKKVHKQADSMICFIQSHIPTTQPTGYISILLSNLEDIKNQCKLANEEDKDEDTTAI